ncbi:MAG: hypothetical protein R3C53_20625 [Pirellulaceae bacterium]
MEVGVADGKSSSFPKGVHFWKFELDGYLPITQLAGLGAFGKTAVRLMSKEEQPEGMAFVPARQPTIANGLRQALADNVKNESAKEKFNISLLAWGFGRLSACLFTF